MTYTINGKNGVTPNSLKGQKTYEAMMKNVNMFIAFNPIPGVKLPNNTQKIAFYNKHSFYTVNTV